MRDALVCPSCGKAFIPESHRQKYCCIACRDAAYKRKPKYRECPYCGEEFMQRTNKVFCCGQHRRAFYKLLD